MDKIKRTIKLHKNSKPITLNELAKYQVSDLGENAHYWNEMGYHKLNDATTDEITRLLNKHLSRVNNYLGIDKIVDKIYNDK